MIKDLADFAPDLTESDALRLMLTVEHGYAYASPKLQLLVTLGYLWEPDGNHVLYPSVKGQETAVRVAAALWENASHSGTEDDVIGAAARLARIRGTLRAS